MAVVSARGRIRELVKIRIDGAEEFSIPTLTDSVIALLSGDDDFMKEFIQTTLRHEVYTQVAAAVAASRKLVQLGDEVLTPGAIERRAERFASRFLGWYEHAGNRHVNVMEMTREDLLIAAAERSSRGNHELRIAALWTQMADGLEGGQRVQDRFTAEEIEGLYTRIERAAKGAVA
jgi:hypothetical protein